MHLTVILLLVGVVLLVRGGDYFVGASVAIAQFLRIPRIVIGCTIVSIATTTPELTVSTLASLTNHPGIAIGNAVGSAIFNIGFILGLTCLFQPIPVRHDRFCFPAYVLFGSAVLLAFFTLRLTLSRTSGFSLFAVGVLYLAFNYFRHRRSPSPEVDGENVGMHRDPRMTTLGRAAFFFLLGLGMVLGGSKLLIGSAVKIAEFLGVPPLIIGLTLVAAGTSLPELGTAIVSVRKHVADLSLGNIVGASLLCCTVVAGVSAAIGPLTIKEVSWKFNMPALIAIIGTLIVQARAGNRLSRFDGAVLFALYLAYVAGLVLFRVS